MTEQLAAREQTIENLQKLAEEHAILTEKMEISEKERVELAENLTARERQLQVNIFYRLSCIESSKSFPRVANAFSFHSNKIDNLYVRQNISNARVDVMIHALSIFCLNFYFAPTTF